MKKLVILGLTFILLLPLVTSGCGGKEATNNTTTTSQVDQIIEVTLDEFSANAHVIKFIMMAPSDTLEVRLGSNPSTGYEWGDAVFDPPGVVQQVSRNYVEPTNSELVGAPGTDVWVFEATGKGVMTISISYNRPWETEQEPFYSVRINVTVK